MLARIMLARIMLARIKLARIMLARIMLVRIMLARIMLARIMLARIMLARIILARIMLARIMLALIMFARIMPDFVLLQIICNNIPYLQQKSSDFNNHHVAMWSYGPNIVPYDFSLVFIFGSEKRSPSHLHLDIKCYILEISYLLYQFIIRMCATKMCTNHSQNAWIPPTFCPISLRSICQVV